MRRINKLLHHKFCKTEVTIGYYNDTYLKIRFKLRGGSMRTKWSRKSYQRRRHKLSLKAQAKDSQVIKAGEEYSRKNIYRDKEVSKSMLF